MSRQDLGAEIRGDTLSYTIRVTRSGVPVNLTGAKLWMTAKYRFSDPDSQSVFQVSSPSNGIVITDATNGVAVATVPLSSMPTPPVPNLYYDVQLKEADGTITTVAWGILQVLPDVTNSTV